MYDDNDSPPSPGGIYLIWFLLAGFAPYREWGLVFLSFYFIVQVSLIQNVSVATTWNTLSSFG